MLRVACVSQIWAARASSDDLWQHLVEQQGCGAREIIDKIGLCGNTYRDWYFRHRKVTAVEPGVNAEIPDLSILREQVRQYVLFVKLSDPVNQICASCVTDIAVAKDSVIAFLPDEGRIHDCSFLITLSLTLVRKSDGRCKVICRNEDAYGGRGDSVLSFEAFPASGSVQRETAVGTEDMPSQFQGFRIALLLDTRKGMDKGKGKGKGASASKGKSTKKGKGRGKGKATIAVAISAWRGSNHNTVLPIEGLLFRWAHVGSWV